MPFLPHGHWASAFFIARLSLPVKKKRRRCGVPFNWHLDDFASKSWAQKRGHGGPPSPGVRGFVQNGRVACLRHCTFTLGTYGCVSFWGTSPRFGTLKDTPGWLVFLGAGSPQVAVHSKRGWLEVKTPAMARRSGGGRRKLRGRFPGGVCHAASGHAERKPSSEWLTAGRGTEGHEGVASQRLGWVGMGWGWGVEG